MVSVAFERVGSGIAGGLLAFVTEATLVTQDSEILREIKYTNLLSDGSALV
jgi:hypothetical protein